MCPRMWFLLAGLGLGLIFHAASAAASFRPAVAEYPTAGLFNETPGLLAAFSFYVPAARNNIFWGRRTYLYDTGDRVYNLLGGRQFLLESADTDRGLGPEYVLGSWDERRLDASALAPMVPGLELEQEAYFYQDNESQYYYLRESYDLKERPFPQLLYPALQAYSHDVFYFARSLTTAPNLDTRVGLLWRGETANRQSVQSGGTAPQEERREFSTGQWQLIFGGRTRKQWQSSRRLEVDFQAGPVFSVRSGNAVPFETAPVGQNAENIPSFDPLTLVPQTPDTYYPYASAGNGPGFSAQAGVNYTLSPALVTVVRMGYEYVPWSYWDQLWVKDYFSTWSYPNGLYTQVDTTHAETRRGLAGAGNRSLVEGKAQAQWLWRKWKLGTGLLVSIQFDEEKNDESYSDVQVYRREYGAGDPTQDYTELLTSSADYALKARLAVTRLILPLGLVCELRPALSLCLGVQLIRLWETSRLYRKSTSFFGQTVRTYDDGTSTTTTTIRTADAYDDSAWSEPEVRTRQYGAVRIGFSWQPEKYLRVIYLGVMIPGDWGWAGSLKPGELASRHQLSFQAEF